MLSKLDSDGRHVIAARQLAKYFPNDSKRTFQESINRAIKNGLLVRATKGVLVNPLAQCFGQYTIEWIARTLRPDHISYLSLESVLSQYGVISQIMIDRITLMSTGRSGEVHTQYGTIEFTHTKRSALDITQSTYLVGGQPLRIATLSTALRDLNRVGRNQHLVDEDLADRLLKD